MPHRAASAAPRPRSGESSRALLLALALLAARPAAAAPDSCVVNGRLLGCDRRPMRAAFVRPPGPPGSLRMVAPDGHFRVVFPRPGGYFLIVGGVHHETRFLPLLIEKPGVTDLTIRLPAARFRTALDSVRVIGDFNGFAAAGAIPMARRSDGTLLATVPCDRETLRYQLLGVLDGAGAVCGTRADTFVVDRAHPLLEWQSGTMISAVRANRRQVEIVLSPAALPSCDTPLRVTFGDSPGAAARILANHEELGRIRRRETEAFEAFRNAGGDPDSFRVDRSRDLAEIAALADREADPLARGHVVLGYFDSGAVSDSVRARHVLLEIPPASPLWSLVWAGPGNAFAAIADAARDPEAIRAYAERVAASHPDTTVRASFLLDLLRRARASGDRERAARYYTELTGDYPGGYADRARKLWGPGRAIQTGVPCPDFAFADLEDSTRIHRPAEFRGRYLLLDFWATWCGPCRGELPYLSRAYERFRRRGLALLSVSFDRDRQDVMAFRAKTWGMPWLHAFEARGFSGEAARRFELVGIPREILVDPAGRIVAADEELRGGQLEKTLARVLGAPD